VTLIDSPLAELHRVRPQHLMVRAHGTALTIADCFTSLGATNVPMDDWGVDVIGSGSQKGYVMPLGLSFAAMDERAWQARKHCDCRSSTWIYASTAKRPPPTATPLPPPSTST